MNKQKLISICAVVALSAVAVVGGTLAYFTDTEKATNTMVVGNVDITMDEWQYTEDGWAQYDDKEFVLYPLENEQGQLLYNKSVRTYNTSSSGDDVYMRSIILVEANGEVELANNEGACCFPGLHVAHDSQEAYTSTYDKTTHYCVKSVKTLDETVTVDGKEYWVVVYEQKDGKAIPAGQALSSLHSVWMDKNVKADQVDGWGDDGVQVIAFSQGIQAEGLTHAEAMVALGELTVENVQAWVKNAEVMA